MSIEDPAKYLLLLGKSLSPVFQVRRRRRGRWLSVRGQDTVSVLQSRPQHTDRQAVISRTSILWNLLKFSEREIFRFLYARASIVIVIIYFRKCVITICLVIQIRIFHFNPGCRDYRHLGVGLTAITQSKLTCANCSGSLNFWIRWLELLVQTGNSFFLGFTAL